MAASVWSPRLTARRFRWGAIVLAVLVLTLTSSGSTVRSSGERILVPVGRSAVVGPNRFEAIIDDDWSGSVVADGRGGYWLSLDPIPADGASLVLRMTVDSSPTQSLGRDLGSHDWLAPTALIDSAHPAITSTSRSIAEHHVSAVDKATAIHAHIASTLTWRRYPRHQDDPASTTLALGYGTCGGHARLFVALSRAAGVPARTVQGVIFDEGTTDVHHQWAEYRDEAYVWHAVDPTTAPDFDTSSRVYLDLVYAAEDNPFWTDPNLVIAYDATPHDGRLGYRLIDTTGTICTIENTYTLDAYRPTPP